MEGGATEGLIHSPAASRTGLGALSPGPVLLVEQSSDDHMWGGLQISRSDTNSDAPGLWYRIWPEERAAGAEHRPDPGK